MATSLNRAQILGNVGKDPEMRYTPSGQAVTQFSVATSRSWKAAGSEEWQEETQWHRIIVWGRDAETVAERVRKGHKVYVEGRLQTRDWEDANGQRRYTTEVVASSVLYLEKREGAGYGGAARQIDAIVDAQAAAGQTGTRAAAGPEERVSVEPYPDLDDLPF